MKGLGSERGLLQIRELPENIEDRKIRQIMQPLKHALRVGSQLVTGENTDSLPSAQGQFMQDLNPLPMEIAKLGRDPLLCKTMDEQLQVVVGTEDSKSGVGAVDQPEFPNLSQGDSVGGDVANDRQRGRGSRNFLEQAPDRIFEKDLSKSLGLDDQRILIQAPPAGAVWDRDMGNELASGPRSRDLLQRPFDLADELLAGARSVFKGQQMKRRTVGGGTGPREQGTDSSELTYPYGDGDDITSLEEFDASQGFWSIQGVRIVGQKLA